MPSLNCHGPSPPHAQVAPLHHVHLQKNETVQDHMVPLQRVPHGRLQVPTEWWGCGCPPVVPPPIRAFMWEGLWPPKCACGTSPHPGTLMPPSNLMPQACVPTGGVVGAHQWSHPQLGLCMWECPWLPKYAWVPPTIISPSIWALTKTLNLALMPISPFPRYISHKATQPHLGVGAWGYKPLSWHTSLLAQRMVLPMAYALPLTCPRLGGKGGGGAKGSGGGEVTGGYGGCIGAMVGTTCASWVIYIAGRPPYLHFTKCPYLLQIRCGRDYMAFQSPPYFLTFPWLPFEENTLDWGAVYLCL